MRERVVELYGVRLKVMYDIEKPSTLNTCSVNINESFQNYRGALIREEIILTDF